MKTTNNANSKRNTEMLPRLQSAMAQLNRDAKDAYDKMRGEAAKALSGTLSPDQIKKLLDAVCNLDEKDRELLAQSITILDYYKEIGQEFNPEISLTVGNLTSIGRDYARAALGGATIATIEDLGDRFSWSDACCDYPSSLIFVADDNTPLHYESNGDLRLRHLERGDSSSPSGLDFQSDGLELSWGKYELGSFLLTSPSTATHLLVSAYWGGPHSTTRGVDTNTNLKAFDDRGCVYTEKQQSKRGKEGRDYYVFSLKVDEKLKQWSTIQSILTGEACAVEEADFASRYEVIKSLDAQYDAIEHAFIAADKLFRHCCEYVNENEQLDQPYICCPSMDDIDRLDFSGRNYSLQMSHEQLLGAIIPADEFQRYLRIVELADTLISSWKYFAPKYATLYNSVKEHYGYMMIYADHAEVSLPNNNADSVGAEPIYRVFAFSAGHLKACRDFLAEYAANEKAAKESMALEQYTER